MFLFARDSQHVTATNKMMFWIVIAANMLAGAMFVTGTNYLGQKGLYLPLAFIVGVVAFFCVAGMVCMLFGKRTGGYATIGFSVLLAIGVALLALSAGEDELFNLMGLVLLNLWPTLATLFGAKRISQREVDLKQEMAFKGTALGKVLFGAMYLLAFLTVVFGVIGMP